MYLPEHFHEVDPDRIAALIAENPLASVVAQTDSGLVANHIPLLAGKERELIGHVALANDMHRLMADGHEVLAIFQGADGYVSPNFYPSKANHHRHVPTWNYEVVHVHGQITFQHDLRAKRAAVGLLTSRQELRLNGDHGWRMADAPADYMETMLANIVAFRITIHRTIAKSKLSQNREAGDLRGAIDGLRATGNTPLSEQMAARATGSAKPDA